MACVNKCTNESRFDRSESFRRLSNSNEAYRNDEVYAVDPFKANILDRSISRSYGISSVTLSLSTNNERAPWHPTISYAITTDYYPDNQSSFDFLKDFMFRYGDYEIVATANANETYTESTRNFKQFIHVSELEPFAHFLFKSAKTVPSTYTCDDAGQIYNKLVNISSITNADMRDANNVCFDFISGYAPNLTVYFQDSSDAHTFPIEDYHWDFGDSYNEGLSGIYDIDSNWYTLTGASITEGSFDSPNWRTNYVNHTARHTYIMPGNYNITLTVKASVTDTTDTYFLYDDIINTKRFSIYVEEIPPIYNNNIKASLNSSSGFTSSPSGINGNSPSTIYFHATGISAGSFPFHRIDWDFGDGNIQKVTRFPLTTATNQNLNIINISAYSHDINDPRNFIIPHTYSNLTDAANTYSINISAYVSNTNTMVSGSAYNVVVINSQVNDEEVFEIISNDLSIKRNVTENRKIVGSRFDDYGNLIYIFEGQNDNTLYTVALSGEI